jgi:hypothetical protein
MATNKAFSPQAREAGAKARRKMATLRDKVARRHGLRVSDLYRSKIWDTLAVNKIPINDIPIALLPKESADSGEQVHKKKPNGNGGEGWVSMPLDAIPEKVKTPKTSRVKKFTIPGPRVDNTQVVMRLIDLIERML